MIRTVLFLCLVVVLGAAQVSEFCSSDMGEMEYLPPIPVPSANYWDTPYEFSDWLIEEAEGWFDAPLHFSQELLCDTMQYNLWTDSVDGPVFVLSPERVRVHAPYDFNFMLMQLECIFKVEGGMVQISRWDEENGWLDIKWELILRKMGWDVTYVVYRAYIPPWTQWAMQEYMESFYECSDCVNTTIQDKLQTELGRIKTLVEATFEDQHSAC